MIFLLSQMLLAIAVAVILGVAIGWLIHRASQKRYNEAIRQTLSRQQRHLAQAQNDVAMLTDDYDDLKNQNQTEIEDLQKKNKQIPFLASNLEKSQLLVRQMMQKHDVKQRELTLKNERLATRIRQLEEQEQLRNTVEAELDSLRREHAAKARAQTALQSGAEDEQQDEVDPENHSEGSRYVVAEAAEDPFDEIMEIGSDLQSALAQDDQTQEDPGSDDTDDSDISDDTDNTDAADDTADDTADNTDGTDTTTETDSELLNETSDESRRLVNSVADEVMLDGSTDAATLFEPVDRQDDLQQIFGIGPVTEKALNKLGITSYSQLAELKHHEIQTIADALEIVPGRIERDNWVGNARRQLEEVLEQL